MDTVLKDLNYALRTLHKNAGFTVVAILTIALGIGACTAVFSVVNGVLLRPLPYGDPARLVLVWSELRTRNVLDFPFPIPDVRDFRESAETFDGVAGITGAGRVAISGETGEPEQVRTIGATTNIFTVLGVPMAAGRNFTDADGTPQPQPPPPPPGAPAAAPAGPPPLPTLAILSHGLWQRRYGSDPNIIGKTIGFGNGRAEVVGVLPANFELLFPPRTGIEPNIDVWTAMRLNFDTAARSTGALRVIGRLKPGVTMAQAQSDADGIAATLRERFPTKKNVDLHFRVKGMHADLVGDVRPLVLSLFGAVVFVLLIACANVANLLLVRAAARQREFVIRTAIGGGRWRLVRQLLTETMLLAGLGGVLGVALGYAGVNLLASMAPPGLPRLGAIQVDGSVLAFSVAATIVTALVCGLVPALRASRQNVADIVRASTPGLRAGRTSALRRRADRSGAVIRAARRIGTDDPQLHRAAAGRSRLRREQRADLLPPGGPADAAGARRPQARDRGAAAGAARRRVGRRVQPLPARRRHRQHPVGDRRSRQRGSGGVPPGQLLLRHPRLLRDDEDTAHRRTDVHRGRQHAGDGEQGRDRRSRRRPGLPQRIGGRPHAARAQPQRRS